MSKSFEFLGLRVQPYAVADRDQVGGEIRSFGRPVHGELRALARNAGYRSWPLQGLGETAAEADISAIRYESVRDPETDHHGNGAGRSVGLLSSEVFQPPHPLQPQTWYLYLGLQEANVRRALAGPGEQFDFPRAMLEMAGPPI